MNAVTLPRHHCGVVIIIIIIIISSGRYDSKVSERELFRAAGETGEQTQRDRVEFCRRRGVLRLSRKEKV